MPSPMPALNEYASDPWPCITLESQPKRPMYWISMSQMATERSPKGQTPRAANAAQRIAKASSGAAKYS